MRIGIDSLVLALLISSVLGPPVFGKDKVKISDEILRVSGEINRLKLDSKDTNQKDILDLSRYLDFLNWRSELAGKIIPCSESEEVIGESFQTKLLSALKWLDKKGTRFTAQSVYELLDYIQKNKSEWRKWKKNSSTGYAPLTFESTDKKLKANFDIDSKGNVLLKFKDRTLGEGCFKVVSKVKSYKTWTNLALGRIKDPSNLKKLEEFKREGVILGEISNLPIEKKRGLVDTVSWSESEIVQTMYDGDLHDAIYGTSLTPAISFSRAERIEGVSQATDGLVQLHSMGIGHYDIKPENLLYRTVDLGFGKKGYEIVLTDFGLSQRTDPLIEDGQPRPQVGTPLYMAPEVVDRIWYGSTKAEKKDFAYRADVYSHALTTYELLKGVAHPAVHDCEGTAMDVMDYLDCRERKIASKIEADRLSKSYNSEEHLYLRAMHQDPRKRISMKQFQDGVNWLKVKEPDTTTKVSLETVLGNFTDLGMKNLSSKGLEGTFKGKPAGTYLLKPTSVSGGFRVGLAYVDQDGKFVSKELDVSPTNKEQVRGELEFLRSIGTITTPIGG